MPSLSRAVEHLHRERLVQFPQADVVDLEAEALRAAWDREHRADAHLVGLGAGDRHADVAAERREPALLGDRRLPSGSQAELPSQSWLALPAVIDVSGPSTGFEA